MLDVGEPALGAVAALLGARGFGARFADRFERGARGLVGVGERRSRLRPAGRRRRGAPPVAVSISPISAWRCAANFSGAWSSSVRSVGRFLGALPDGGDLRRGVVLALAPGLRVRRRSPAAGGWRARPCARSSALRRAPRRARAVARDRSLTCGELGFDLGGGRQRGERLLRFAARRDCLVAAGAWCAAAPPAAPRCAPRCG